MIAFRTAATESSLAEPLIAKTEARLRADIAPVWVSDGLDAYGAALFKRKAGTAEDAEACGMSRTALRPGCQTEG